MPPQTDTDKIIEILLILFLPPLAVWYHEAKKTGSCTCHVCLNIFLLIFVFVIPSYVHAIWYCFLRDRDDIPATNTEAPPAPSQAPPAYSTKS